MTDKLENKIKAWRGSLRLNFFPNQTKRSSIQGYCLPTGYSYWLRATEVLANHKSSGMQSKIRRMSEGWVNRWLDWLTQKIKSWYTWHIKDMWLQHWRSLNTNTSKQPALLTLTPLKPIKFNISLVSIPRTSFGISPLSDPFLLDDVEWDWSLRDKNWVNMFLK